MRHYYHLSIVFLLLFPLITIFGQDPPKKKNIAVVDLESRGGLSAAEIGTLTDRLRSMLVQTRAFNVVDRGRMQNILEEQGFQMSGCTSNECAVEAGKILGVEQMVSGTLGRLGELYTIDILLIEVESSKIIRSLARDHEGKIEGLIPVMKEIAEDLAGIKEEVAVAFGGVRIETDPDGVDIFIDGIIKGKTPFTVNELPVGKHSLKLSKTGFADYETEINIAKDQIRNISTELLKAYAFTVTSKPPGADVFINGQKVAVTPYRGYFAIDTELKVELKKINYEVWNEEYTIDRHQTINAEMEYTDAYAESLARQTKEQKDAAIEPTGEEGSSTWLWIGAGAVAVGAAAFLLMPQDDGSGGSTAQYPVPPDRPVE